MEPVRVYEDVVHGQRVLVKRYPTVEPAYVTWTRPVQTVYQVDPTWKDEVDA